MSSQQQTSRHAFVTLATNERYACGALVLGQSLRNVQTQHELVIIVTPGVSSAVKLALSRVFTRVVTVDPLNSEDPTHLALMSRPELGITFTKLHCWNLTDYSKCVFLDADTLVLTNVDDLFDRPELSAAPDVGWPDCFNTGVFVFQPSRDTFNSLVQLAVSQGSFDGADQGLLNQYFNTWSTSDASHRLPFVYNMAATTSYTYLPAFLHYGRDTKIVHFLGSQIKPWDHSYDASTGEVHLHPGTAPGTSQFTAMFLQRWWEIYREQVGPVLEDVLGAGACTSGSDSSYRLPSTVACFQATGHGSAPGHSGRGPIATVEAWEIGKVDYTGSDRFENIQRHLDEMMKLPAKTHAAATTTAAAGDKKIETMKLPGKYTDDAKKQAVATGVTVVSASGPKK
jgi:glycogenin glucosyltransferase